jgi:PAS domain S-box-containing protein
MASEVSLTGALAICATLALVHLTTYQNYLLFHTIAEFFSIFIALMIFVIVVNTVGSLTSNYMRIAGPAYLSIGILDALHALSYRGMPIFTDYDYYGPQFWIAARYVEAISMLVAFAFVGRPRANMTWLTVFYLLATAALTYSIFGLKVFPVCFVAGVGLTPFKVGSEFCICSLLIAALVVLWWRRSMFALRVYQLLRGSLLLMVLAELCFTLYSSDAMSDLINEIGHLLKIVAFYLVYRAVVVTCLRSPIDLVERALVDSQQRARLATETTGVGIWEWNVITDAIRWDPQMFRLYGIAPTSDGFIKYSDWAEAVVPDELAAQEALLREHLHKGGTNRRDFHIRRRDNGECRAIHAAETVRANAHGETEWVIGTNLDITEQKKAEEALALAKAEADRASLAKSKFLAAASHDLRQPVQSLVLFLSVLKAHATTPVVARATSAMETALEGLNGLLASILDVSRIDAGVVTPQMQSVDIGGLVLRLGTEYAPACGQKGLRMRFRSKPGLHARTDAALLERVIRNLIENAIRYTDHGGLLIGTRQRGDRQRIDIVDSGIGIPADKLTHIFEEFYQVANSARDARQGLGLGLSIVSRLARLIGAEVQVRSHLGRGTCFSLLLPRDAVSLEVSSPSAVPEVVTGQRIMVIEDNPTVRKGLQLMLEGWNCEVVSAATGEEALEAGDREGWRFDAVIADHRLGAGLSGTETAIAIGKRAGRAMPTLIVTGDTASERIEEVHASGFEMMHKPVTPDELARRMAQLLRGGVEEGSEQKTVRDGG